MTEVKLKKKSQEEIIMQLIFDVSALRVQLERVQSRFNNHKHWFTEIPAWDGDEKHTSKPLIVEEEAP